MGSISGLNKFNNLLFSTKKSAITNIQEHEAGHVGLNLKPKKPSRINEVLTAGVSQINGKRGDFKYEPTITRSRPYHGYDAKYDPTILNSIRNKFVDVSGTLIPNSELNSKGYIQQTVKPLRSYGIIT